MKTCKDCGKDLPLSSYRPKASNKGGHETRCKDCRNIKYSKADPRRVFSHIYKSQINRSIIRGQPLPTYTLEELKNWVDDQPKAWEIWEGYVSSDYKNSLRPSIDRLENTKRYLGNRNYPDY